MTRFVYAFLVVLFIGMLPVAGSAAPVTPDIPYQGKLTDPSGNPLTGTYGMTFTLYDVAKGGTPLSIDTHLVTVTNGLFTTTITVTDPAILDGRALWLGVKVGIDAEMTPRQPLQPVPYALGLRPGVVGASFTTGEAGTSASNTRAGVNVSTNYNYNPGVWVNTVGNYSSGVSAETSGLNSPGVSAVAWGGNSQAVRGISADGYGIYGSGKGGAYFTPNQAGTSETPLAGVYVPTWYNNNPGVKITTDGDDSYGVIIDTNGPASYGVNVTANGRLSFAVTAVSNQFWGIFAATNRTDHRYGLYTPDYIYAMGAQYPAADVAEYMPVTDAVSPGTVLVIGEDGRLTPASTAYDTRVAGIVSTNPGVFLGTKENGNEGEALIAVAGRVPCKVDATYGAIHPGDLLSTSDTPGHAMKAEPIEVGGRTFYPSGIVLGKALGTLESGRGTIEVIVTLQ